jgi:hypothetical protein
MGFQNLPNFKDAVALKPFNRSLSVSGKLIPGAYR